MKIFGDVKLHNTRVLQDGIDFGQIHTDNLENPELDLDDHNTIIVTSDDLNVNTFNKMTGSWEPFIHPNDMNYLQDVFVDFNYLEMIRLVDYEIEETDGTIEAISYDSYLTFNEFYKFNFNAGFICSNNSKNFLSDNFTIEALIRTPNDPSPQTLLWNNGSSYTEYMYSGTNYGGDVLGERDSYRFIPTFGQYIIEVYDSYAYYQSPQAYIKNDNNDVFGYVSLFYNSTGYAHFVIDYDLGTISSYRNNVIQGDPVPFNRGELLRVVAKSTSSSYNCRLRINSLNTVSTYTSLRNENYRSLSLSTLFPFFQSSIFSVSLIDDSIVVDDINNTLINHPIEFNTETEFNHMAIVKDGTDLKLYLDLNLIETVSMPDNLSSFNDFVIGNYGYNYVDIENFRISDIARYTGSTIEYENKVFGIDANTHAIIRHNKLLNQVPFYTIDKSLFDFGPMGSPESFVIDFWMRKPLHYKRGTLLCNTRTYEHAELGTVRSLVISTSGTRLTPDPTYQAPATETEYPENDGYLNVYNPDMRSNHLINDGLLHHVALVRDVASETTYLFIDGVLNDSAPMEEYLFYYDVSIGYGYFESFEGEIAKFRVSKNTTLGWTEDFTPPYSVEDYAITANTACFIDGEVTNGKIIDATGNFIINNGYTGEDPYLVPSNFRHQLTREDNTRLVTSSVTDVPVEIKLPKCELGLSFTFRAPVGNKMIISMMVEDTCDSNYGKIVLYDTDGMLEIVAQSNNNWIISKSQLGSPVSLIDSDHTEADYRHLYYCSREYGLIDAKTLKDGITPVDVSNPDSIMRYPYTKPYDNCPGVIDLQYESFTMPEVPYYQKTPISMSFWMYIEYPADYYDVILSCTNRSYFVDLVSYRTGNVSYIYFSSYRGAYNYVHPLINNAWNYITLGYDGANPSTNYWWISANDNPWVSTGKYCNTAAGTSPVYLPNVINQVPTGRKVFLTDICYRDEWSLRDKSLLYDHITAIS